MGGVGEGTTVVMNGEGPPLIEASRLFAIVSAFRDCGRSASFVSLEESSRERGDRPLRA